MHDIFIQRGFLPVSFNPSIFLNKKVRPFDSFDKLHEGFPLLTLIKYLHDLFSFITRFPLLIWLCSKTELLLILMCKGLKSTYLDSVFRHRKYAVYVKDVPVSNKRFLPYRYICLSILR